MAADETLTAQLLAILNDGRLHTTTELASRLQVSEELVRAMADDLTQHGYLLRVQSDCVPACSGCSLAGLCAGLASAPSSGQLFSLTARGRRVARSLAGAHNVQR
jgi:hypothetical protein